jgi:hypothetical protein
MDTQLFKVTFVRAHSPSQGSGYNAQEEAAFPLDQAVVLIAKGVAEFSDPADFEANRKAVEIAKRTRPEPWVRRMVRADSRRWG